MRRLIFVVLALFFTSAACSVGFPRVTRGSGNIVTQSFDVTGFDQVQLDTVGAVYVEQGDSESLTVETDDNILPLLEVSVKDGKLILGAEDFATLDPTATITFRVTVKDVSVITVNSSGDVFADSLSGESLAVHLNASGDVTLGSVEVKTFSVSCVGSGDVSVEDLQADDVQLELNSSGNIRIAGETPSLNVNISGSGDVSAGDLQAADVTVAIPGSGNATVWAVNSLDITLSASGNLSYYGDPTLTQNASSSGDLLPLGEK